VRFVMHARVVLVTTFWRKVFTGQHLIRLEEIMRDV